MSTSAKLDEGRRRAARQAQAWGKLVASLRVPEAREFDTSGLTSRFDLVDLQELGEPPETSPQATEEG